MRRVLREQSLNRDSHVVLHDMYRISKKLDFTLFTAHYHKWPPHTVFLKSHHTKVVAFLTT